MFSRLIKKFGLIKATIITTLMIVALSLAIACIVNTLIGRQISLQTFLVSVLVPSLVAPAFIYVHFSLLRKLMANEQLLTQKTTEFRNLINNIPGLVYRGNPDWSTELISETKEICGYTEQEINSFEKGWLQVVHPEDIGLLMEENKMLFPGETSLVQTYRIISKDGETRWVQDRKKSFFSADGSFLGVEGIIFDITEQHKMEVNLHQAHKLESIGVLAGGIAHDYNNILTGIIGNLSLLKRYLEQNNLEDARERIFAMEKATCRAQDLTYQLLTFSKGGAPIKKVLSVSKLIEESVMFTLCGASVKCDFSADPETWPAEVDPGQFSQVLQNLTINAVDAMPEGGKIEIQLKNHIAKRGNSLNLYPGNYVEVSICDEGKGIPTDIQNKIFDPFFTTKKAGSGLGLAICHSIIKKHNGMITFDSAENRGTCFHIFLPASQEKPVLKDIKNNNVVMGRGRILIMDDDELVKTVASEMLSHAGYKVELASDGIETLDHYRNAMETGQPYDLVILDLIIPGGMGGKETITKLLEIDPHVKGVVSSGFSTDPILSDYRKYGFYGAISKPYKLDELTEKLAELLT